MICIHKQVAAERDRAAKAEDRVQQLEKELKEVKDRSAAEREQQEAEAMELRRALERSVAVERKLRALNEEAWRLLILKGVNP